MVNVSKATLIYVAVLVLVFAGLAVAYKFILEAQTQQFAAAEKFSQELESKSMSLARTFSQTDPEVVLRSYESQIEPWREAAERRTNQFQMSDAVETEEVPEDKLPRFYYEDRYLELARAFYEDLAQRGMMQAVNLGSTGGGMGGMGGMGGGKSGGFSGSGSGLFGAQDPSGLAGSAIDEEQINYWLWRLRLGIETVQQVLDAGAVYIGGIDIWDKHTEYGVLECYSVGLYFGMRMQDFIEFTNQILTDPDQYYRIDGLRIGNRNLASSADPILEIEMVLTRARFVEGGTPAASRGVGGGRMDSGFDSGMGGFMDPFGMPGMGPMGGRGSKSRGAPVQRKKAWYESLWDSLWPF